MGKFSSYYYRPKIESNPDIIRDINTWLSAGYEVYLTYDSSKISRVDATGLLKLIPTENVFKVRVIEKKDFEREKEKSGKPIYPISVDELLRLSNKLF